MAEVLVCNLGKTLKILYLYQIFRGIITFKISPHEQRAFAGAISQGLPNIFTRIRSELFYVAVRK